MLGRSKKTSVWEDGMSGREDGRGELSTVRAVLTRAAAPAGRYRHMTKDNHVEKKQDPTRWQIKNVPRSADVQLAGSEAEPVPEQ